MSDPERRELEFLNWNEVIADIENLAGGNTRTVGKHKFPAIIRHLSIANEMLVGDLVPPKLPFVMRLLMPLMRNSILNGPVKPGFKLPTKDMQSFFWPADQITVADAVARFKKSLEKYQQVGPLPAHPLFGKATAEQIETMSLRHAAMHLSFVHPE